MRDINNWCHFFINDNEIVAGFTYRGINQDASNMSPYDKFNLCHYTGDDFAHIDQCKNELAEVLKISVKDIVVPRQTHSNRVLVVDSSDIEGKSLENVDALVTKCKRMLIGVNTADCLPLIVIDERAGVTGVAHAGWRGAVNGVIENLLKTMKQEGSNMEDCKAYIGPTICEDCFEVGEEVAEQFPEDCVNRRFSKPHVNLPKFAHDILKTFGLKEENIISSPQELCTHCHPRIFFSARKEGINSGRNYSFVMMK